jgi:hypothetical protein
VGLHRLPRGRHRRDDRGGLLLEYPADLAKTLMLLVETWLTVSIGAILVSLFIASASPAEELRMRSGVDR